MKTCYALLLGFLCVVLWPMKAEAQTACDRASVVAAINAAATGATVTLTTCTCSATNITWDPPITISKHITLKGQGIDQTCIKRPTGAKNQALIWNISPGQGAAAKLQDITFVSPTPSDPNTIGFDSERALVLAQGSSDPTCTSPSSSCFVMQRVRLNDQQGMGVIIQGDVRGVGSEVRCEVRSFDVCGQVRHFNWNNVGGSGDNSWAVATALGNTATWVFEDSTFIAFLGSYAPCLNTYGGGRLTFRFNVVQDCQIYQHGLDTPYARGARQWEYYRNRTINTAMGGVALFGLRAGTGVGWDNTLTVSGGGSSPRVMDYWVQRASLNPAGVGLFYQHADCRVRTLTSISCAGGVATVQMPSVSAGQTSHGFTTSSSVTIAGTTGAAYDGTYMVTAPNHTYDATARQTFTTFSFAHSCVGSVSGGTIRNPLDGNTNSAGYPCADSIGRGIGALLNYNALNTSIPPVGGAAQAKEPVYIWRNTLNGSLSGFGTPSSDHTDPNAVAENQDYYNQNTSFTGATGIGLGLRSARPGSCVAGVAYVATDDSNNWNQETSLQHNIHDPASTNHTLGADLALDKCPSGSWVNASYVPLIYPHPMLTGSAGNQPPVVSITSHAATVDTTASTLAISGTCSDDSGACTSVAYTCVLDDGGASCGSGSPTGLGSWSIASASIPSGVSTWCATASDGSLSSEPSCARFYRVAAATLPHTENFSIGASVTWPGYGANWSRVGTAQYGITSQQGGVIAAGFNGLLFTGTALNSDQYIEATAMDVSPLSKQIRFCFSASGTAGQTSNFNGYIVQFDGPNSATNLTGRYDGGAFTTNYTPGGFGTVAITNGATIVGAKKVGNTIQAYTGTYPGTDVGPLVTTAGEYTGGTVGDCSVGVGTLLDNITLGNASSPGDVTNPVVTIDTPTSSTNYHATANFTIEAEVSDNVGIFSCTLTNSQAGTIPLTPSGGRVSSDITIVNGIQYTLTITCIDAVNNQGSGTLAVSTDAPAQPGQPSALRGIF